MIDVFLMHRVELKDLSAGFYEVKLVQKVPNAPCGVESNIIIFVS